MLTTIRLTLYSLALAAMLAIPAGAVEIQLKSSLVVEGSMITLGDLFDGAGTAGNAPLAEAPAPGQKVMMRPSYVAGVAYQAGLSWLPPAGLNRIIVTRASNLVASQDIQTALQMALRPLVDAADMDIQWAARGVELHVPANRPASVAIDDISYDSLSNQFRASLRAPADDPNGIRQWIAGRVFPLKEIPVLARRIDVGQEIRAQDIELIRARAETLNRFIVVESQDLVGLAPRRVIAVGRPIRSSDLQRPELITKGALVTMALQSGRLSLTAVGRALEGGAQGDMIRLINTQSHKTIQGTIVAANRVVITLPGQLAAASTMPTN